MIGFIKGTMIYSDQDSLVLLNGGIGWEVNVFDTTIFTIGETYELYCHTHYTQDKTSIWGLENIEKLIMFKKLIGVSGVGPRTAITLLGNKNLSEISAAIEEGDLGALKVKGLGQKTLQKIIIDLKGKVDLTRGPNKAYSGKLNDILIALVNLGYAKNDVVAFFDSKGDSYFIDVDEKLIIKEFLKEHK